MGRLYPGVKISRKHITRAADEWKRQASERAGVIQQALLYNAALHKSLQHELCTCEHGASKHLGTADSRCTVVDCNCPGYKSNRAQAFDNWIGDIRARLQQAGLPYENAATPEHPLHPTKQDEEFDRGRTAEEFVKLVTEYEDDLARKAAAPALTVVDGGAQGGDDPA